RPFHKNDNPRVEQKNATLVRAYLGDRRLDSVPQSIALNVLYDKMWAYYNLFQPVMHLAEKKVIREPGKPVRVRRKHDQPATPFVRLCETSAILPEHKAQLEALRDSINPLRLRQDIYDAIKEIFKLPAAVPGVTENVHLTLTDGEDRWLNLAFNRTPMRDDHGPTQYRKERHIPVTLSFDLTGPAGTGIGNSQYGREDESSWRPPARPQRLPNPICMTTRQRLDAALHKSAPPGKPGETGQARLRGARLPTLEQTPQDPKTT
ncbi:MAG: hypothetical protein MUQ10_12670, partial [Anaerolineae bacterium]|nr:hypothetical protein [Anaerolineae bacterium]